MVCRLAVTDAGCELQPDWAGGAWIFFPLTLEMFEEADLSTTAIRLEPRKASGRDVGSAFGLDALGFADIIQNVMAA